MRQRTTLTSREASEPLSATPAFVAPRPSMTLSCTETSRWGLQTSTPFSSTPRAAGAAGARRPSRRPPRSRVPRGRHRRRRGRRPARGDRPSPPAPPARCPAPGRAPSRAPPRSAACPRPVARRPAGSAPARGAPSRGRGQGAARARARPWPGVAVTAGRPRPAPGHRDAWRRDPPAEAVDGLHATPPGGHVGLVRGRARTARSCRCRAGARRHEGDRDDPRAGPPHEARRVTVPAWRRGRDNTASRRTVGPLDRRGRRRATSVTAGVDIPMLAGAGSAAAGTR